MALGTFVLVNPTGATAPVRPAKMALRLETLNGKVLGLLDNGKQNALPFLQELGELLRARYCLREVVAVTKPSAGRDAPPALLDGLASRCHMVITGVGD